MQRVGINPAKLRFRQHLSTEMAHYAMDCWDAEILTSYGWVECVGIADRACYDLDVHAERTKKDMSASQLLDTPREEHTATLKLNKGMLGKTLKGDAAAVAKALEALVGEEAMAMEAALASTGTVHLAVEALGGKTVEISRAMASWKMTKKMIKEVKYKPGVIEPSFGLGRIIYCIFEHAYYSRPEDAQRAVLSLPPIMAPFTCCVLPLTSDDFLRRTAKMLSDRLTDLDVRNRMDASSTSIGRRYARFDELGVSSRIAA